MGEIGCPLLSPLTSSSPLQIFKACNILIGGQKHKVWVFIARKILVIKLLGFAEIFTFSTPALVVSVLADIAHYATTSLI